MNDSLESKDIPSGSPSDSPYRSPSEIPSDASKLRSALKWAFVVGSLLFGLSLAFATTVFFVGFGGMRRGRPRPNLPVVEDNVTAQSVTPSAFQSEAIDE